MAISVWYVWHDYSFIHLLYMKPTEYIITTLKIKTYQLSAHWQLQGR